MTDCSKSEFSDDDDKGKEDLADIEHRRQGQDSDQGDAHVRTHIHSPSLQYNGLHHRRQKATPMKQNA